MLAALSIALLGGPVAFHRLVFRQHPARGRLVRAANAVTIAGLATVALALSVAVVLVVSFVTTGPAVPLIGALTVGGFAALWFAVPLIARRWPPDLGADPRRSAPPRDE